MKHKYKKYNTIYTVHNQGSLILFSEECWQIEMVRRVCSERMSVGTLSSSVSLDALCTEDEQGGGGVIGSASRAVAEHGIFTFVMITNVVF